MTEASGLESRPDVSVIVPFYQSERIIEACVESLLAQRDRGHAVELIFIDNGARDASASIVKRFEAVTLLEESKPGAYAARNAGLAHARAPIIAFTDADCVVDVDWVDALLSGMEDSSVGALVGHCRYPESASRTLRLLGAYENAKTDYVLGHLPSRHWFAYANNMAVRADLFRELGPFLEWRRAGDSEFVHRIAKRRPDLRVVFHETMRITHHEFVEGRQRAQRLSLYKETNSQIETFRELSLLQRLVIGGRLALGLRRFG